MTGPNRKSSRLELRALILLAQFVASTAANGDAALFDYKCTSSQPGLGSSSKTVTDLNADVSKATAAAGSCQADLTAADRAELKSIYDEMAPLEPLNKPGPERAGYNQKVSQIIGAHYGRLSVAAKKALLADSYKRRLEGMTTELKRNAKFAKAYLKFTSAVERTISKADRWFGGMRDNQGMNELGKAVPRLYKALQEGNLPEADKVLIRDSINQIAQNAFNHQINASIELQRKASIGKAIAGGVLVVDLVALSIVTGGAASGATGAVGAAVTAGEGVSLGTLFTAAAWTGVSVGAGAGGVVLGAELTKIAGKAAVSGNPSASYYCRLADEMSASGDEAFHKAVVASAWGAGFGFGLGLLSPLPALAGVIKVSTGLIVSGCGLVASGKAGFDYYTLLQRAHEAEESGDHATSVALIEQAHRKAVDGGVDGVVALFGGLMSLKSAASIKDAAGNPVTYRQALAAAWAEVQAARGKVPVPAAAPQAPVVAAEPPVSQATKPDVPTPQEPVPVAAEKPATVSAADPKAPVPPAEPKAPAQTQRTAASNSTGKQGGSGRAAQEESLPKSKEVDELVKMREEAKAELAAVKDPAKKKLLGDLINEIDLKLPETRAQAARAAATDAAAKRAAQVTDGEPLPEADRQAIDRMIREDASIELDAKKVATARNFEVKGRAKADPVELKAASKLISKANQQLEGKVAETVLKETGEITGYQKKWSLRTGKPRVVDRKVAAEEVAKNPEDGGNAHEVDIETRKFFVEVTVGDGKTTQLQSHYFSPEVNPQGKPVIVYMRDATPVQLIREYARLENPRNIPVIFVRDEGELVQAIRAIQGHQ